MLGRRFAGLELGEADAIEPRAGVQFHHVHAGNIAGLDHASGAFGAVETGQQQTTRLIGHVVAQQVFFFVPGIVVVADHHFETLGSQDPMNGFQGVDEQQVGQRRHQHHHRMALGRSQGAGGGVDDVVELHGGLADLFHQIDGYGADAAQGTGGGDRADTGQACDFVERRATGGASILIVFRGGHQGGLPNKNQGTKVALSRRGCNCVSGVCLIPRVLVS